MEYLHPYRSDGESLIIVIITDDYHIHSIGEKDKLKEMLRERLVQCGWRDELKEYCKEVIRKKGLEKVTVEELVADITPQGRGT